MTPVLVVWQPAPDAPERAARYIKEQGLVAIVPQFVYAGDDWVSHAEKLLDVCSELIVLWDPEGDPFPALKPLLATAEALGVPSEDEYLADPIDQPGLVERLFRGIW